MSAFPSPAVQANDDPPALRVCIVYDALYPCSIGGAERWYRLLAERLAADGHDVSYLTPVQWAPDRPPSLSGVRLLATSAAGGPSYAHGRRRLASQVMFAFAVWRHHWQRSRRYDVVHTAALSPLTALGLAALGRWRGFRLVLDWWEVWTWSYWRHYLGPFSGTAAWLLQRALMLSPHQPIVYSRVHEKRLRRRRDAPALLLRGLLPAQTPLGSPEVADATVIFAGRHIPEKQVERMVPAAAIARERIPDLRAIFFGEGPSRQAVRDAIVREELSDAIALPGFVDENELREQLRRALCLVLPSRREGFGLIVAEAAALGVPSVVLAHPDSAAGELICDGVNGFMLRSGTPAEIASAILRVHDAGFALRQRTLEWFHRQAADLTIEGSLPRILATYRGSDAAQEGNRW